MRAVTFSERMDMLGSCVGELEAVPSQEKASEAAAMLQVCDRLVECGRQSPRLLRRYNELKSRYRCASEPYRELEDEISACRVHVEALKRQSSIADVVRDVQEVIAISDYISYAVGGARHPIDSIAEHLESGEAYGVLANEEMCVTRSRKGWQAGVARAALLFVSVVAAALVAIKLIL